MTCRLYHEHRNQMYQTVSQFCDITLKVLFCGDESMSYETNAYFKKGKRKVQGVSQSQNAALPRPQEEEETDKSKQAIRSYIFEAVM